MLATDRQTVQDVAATRRSDAGLAQPIFCMPYVRLDPGCRDVQRTKPTVSLSAATGSANPGTGGEAGSDLGVS